MSDHERPNPASAISEMNDAHARDREKTRLDVARQRLLHNAAPLTLSDDFLRSINAAMSEMIT